MVGSKSLSRSAFLEVSQERIPGGIPGTRSWGVFRKREYLVNILIMHEQHFHFYSLVVGRRQDHPAACPQLWKESESAACALLKCLPGIPFEN